MNIAAVELACANLLLIEVYNNAIHLCFAVLSKRLSISKSRIQQMVANRVQNNQVS